MDAERITRWTWKDRKAILPAIKAISRAENADMALVRLEEFEAEWGKRYPSIGRRRAWEHVVPFFVFALSVRKMIYTTNAVEALHRSRSHPPLSAIQLATNRQFPANGRAVQRSGTTAALACPAQQFRWGSVDARDSPPPAGPQPA